MFWKLIVVGVCMLFIGGILGALIIPRFLGNTQKVSQSGTIAPESAIDTTNQNYQAGFDAAKKLVEDSSLGNFFRTETDVRTVSGTVTAIDGNRITIHDESIGNPFDGPALSDRTIITNTETKAIKLTEKTSAEIQTEADAYFKAQKTLGTPVPVTTPYIETSVDVSSIQAGDVLTVVAGENVKTSKEFTAQEVRIQPKTSSK